MSTNVDNKQCYVVKSSSVTQNSEVILSDQHYERLSLANKAVKIWPAKPSCWVDQTHLQHYLFFSIILNILFETSQTRAHAEKIYMSSSLSVKVGLLKLNVKSSTVTFLQTTASFDKYCVVP